MIISTSSFTFREVIFPSSSEGWRSMHVQWRRLVFNGCVGQEKMKDQDDCENDPINSLPPAALSLNTTSHSLSLPLSLSLSLSPSLSFSLALSLSISRQSNIIISWFPRQLAWNASIICHLGALSKQRLSFPVLWQTQCHMTHVCLSLRLYSCFLCSLCWMTDIRYDSYAVWGYRWKRYKITASVGSNTTLLLI